MVKISLKGTFTADDKHNLRSAILAASGDDIVLAEKDLSCAIFLAREEARRWRTSNKRASDARKNEVLFKRAVAEDPELKALLAAKGINL